jgi:hypothetical protein
VVPWRLSAQLAESRIRGIAETDSNRVIIGTHARGRMVERDFTDMELFRILRTGHVIEEPTLTEKREWKAKIIKKLRGQREAGVITIFTRDNSLFVKTIEWEDWR